MAILNEIVLTLNNEEIIKELKDIQKKLDIQIQKIEKKEKEFVERFIDTEWVWDKGQFMFDRLLKIKIDLAEQYYEAGKLLLVYEKMNEEKGKSHSE